MNDYFIENSYSYRSFQNEPKPPPPQQQQQTHSNSSGHSTPAWGGLFPHSTPSPQSSSSIFWGNDNQSSSSSSAAAAPKPTGTSINKPSYIEMHSLSDRISF